MLITFATCFVVYNASYNLCVGTFFWCIVFDMQMKYMSIYVYVIFSGNETVSSED